MIVPVIRLAFRAERAPCLFTRMLLLENKTRGDSDSVAGILKRYSRLAAGGLAAVGGATFESSEAALVFTAPNIFLDTDTDPIEGRVDFNGDGNAEVGVVVGSASAADENGNIGMVLGGGLFGADIAFAGRYPIAFQASDFVGESLNFRTAIGTLALSSAGRLGSRGDWFAGRDAYLGARFRMGEEYFYGWVHAVWDPSINTMVIDLAAYEDTGGPAHIMAQKEKPDAFYPTIEGGSNPAEGRVEVSWPALAGKTYELQRSAGLDDWETIHVVTPYMDGKETFLDEEFVDEPQAEAFYRVKQNDMPLLLLAFGMLARRRKGESGEG